MRSTAGLASPSSSLAGPDPKVSVISLASCLMTAIAPLPPLRLGGGAAAEAAAEADAAGAADGGGGGAGAAVGVSLGGGGGVAGVGSPHAARSRPQIGNKCAEARRRGTVLI